MIVMKFGGTSMGSAASMRRVSDIVLERAKATSGSHPVVVVSAVTKVTDRLIAASRAARGREAPAHELVAPIRATHDEIAGDLGVATSTYAEELDRLAEALHGVYLLRELTPRSLDYLMSFGEVLSSRILAGYLSERGVSAKPVTGWDAGLLTNEEHGEAAILPETYGRIEERLGAMVSSTLPVVTGFLAQAASGERTTLGRGGSDYTAAIVGRALRADEVQIWTDVCGIMSCDPRIVTDAYTIRSLTFAEASELAYFGAKVLHPKTVEPAVDVGIPVRVLNTFEPSDPGTLVVADLPASQKRGVEGLSVKRGNLLVHLVSTRMVGAEGYLARVFDAFARHRVSVDCISTSEVSLSLTVDAKYSEALDGALGDLHDHVRASVTPGRAVICAVGEAMAATPGLAGEVFAVMGREGINVEFISQGASKLNITFAVEDAHADRALRALHAKFCAGRPPRDHA
jgi:aspartate kinase